MRHLPIQDESYKILISAFEEYLTRCGYGRGTRKMLPSCIQEFLHRMEHSGIFNLKTITGYHIQKHYQYLSHRPNNRKDGGLSSKMLSHHIHALRVFFAWLVKLDAIEANPISGLEFPEAYSIPRKALSLDEIRALYRACRTDRDTALLDLFYGCGLRRSEGEKLNIQDVSFTEARLIVREGKFNKRREVPLHPTVVRNLSQYISKERITYLSASPGIHTNAFLLTDRGERMRGECANVRVKELAKVAGIDRVVTLHYLRHSIATHLQERGMPMEQVQEFLGHSTLDVTQKYLTAQKTFKYRRKWKSH